MKYYRYSVLQLVALGLFGLCLMVAVPALAGAQSKSDKKEIPAESSSPKLKPPGPPPSGPTDQAVVKPKGIFGSFIFFFQSDVGDKTPGEGKKIPHLTDASLAEYREFGIIEVLGVGENLTLESLLPEIKKQAERMGASAFYKVQINRFTTSGEALYTTSIALRRR